MELLEADARLDVRHILDLEHIELQLDDELELEVMVEIQNEAVIDEMGELEYVDTDDDEDEVDTRLDDVLVMDEEYDDDIELVQDTNQQIIIEDDDEELGIELIELINLELMDANELYSYVIQKTEVMVLKEQSDETNVMNVTDTVYINLHLMENLCQFSGKFLIVK